ncbi:unnamed protein product [Schistosoma margrebowiei]|uniref:Uncharacterized protein n=1 Tax=Schistosoma margrebowiei TaxID=48269 RepID=A0A183LQV4_9TREM|nr:unnamed protein product [Schistosoma margrebowiei]
MKLKLKKHWTTGRTISKKFKFQAFHDLLDGEGTTMKSNWKGIKEANTSTCHEVLGHWITVDTLDKNQERRNKRAVINTSRTRAEKAKAQAEYIEVIRTTSGKKESKLITYIEEQRNMWVEHFKELLNQPASLNPSNIEAAPTNLPIDVGPPTIEEISMAIRQIKSGKAAGPDEIPAEALKADTSTSEEKHGIQWTSRMQLDDLDFAHDLAFLSQTQQQIQEKMTSAAAVSAAVGLNIHKGKSRILRYNTACTNPITIDGEDLEDVKTFTYLGSIIDEHGGSDADVKARIGKATAAYLQLMNIWNLK